MLFATFHRRWLGVESFVGFAGLHFHRRELPSQRPLRAFREGLRSHESRRTISNILNKSPGVNGEAPSRAPLNHQALLPNRRPPFRIELPRHRP